MRRGESSELLLLGLRTTGVFFGEGGLGLDQSARTWEERSMAAFTEGSMPFNFGLKVTGI